MKKFIYLLSFLFLYGCSAQAQEADYKVVWDYNAASDSVDYYNIFIVEVTDTTQTPFIDGVSPDAIRPYQAASLTEAELRLASQDTAVYRFSSLENGKYLQAAATAVNANGESGVAISGFYKKPYILIPSNPNMIKIEK